MIESSFERAASADGVLSFTVYELNEGSEEPRPVGLAGLKDVDFRNRTAEFEIVIGAPNARGRGYGTETTRLVLDYAFTVLSLCNIMLTVYANNPAGIRAYEKAGFREFGRRTAAIEVAGQHFDVVYLECLSDGFESPVLRQLMLPESERQ